MIAPAPIFLAPFLILLIFLSENTPPSPNREPWNISEFLAKPNAEPAIIPPIGPRGVINPASAPPRPNFFTSGIAFIISLLISPLSSLSIFPFSSTFTFPSLSLIALPNNRLEKASVDFVNEDAAPTAAPNKGPPTRRPNPPPIRPLEATFPKNSALCSLLVNVVQSLFVISSAILLASFSVFLSSLFDASSGAAVNLSFASAFLLILLR